jgi:hypothetical protein
MIAAHTNVLRGVPTQKRGWCHGLSHALTYASVQHSWAIQSVIQAELVPFKARGEALQQALPRIHPARHGANFPKVDFLSP